MDFEWDPTKRERNLEKHGVDFLIATQILTGTHVVLRSTHWTEERWIAVGPWPEEHVPADWSGPLCTVVYTKRDDIYRLISARRARTNEREVYRTKISSGDSA